MKSGKLTILIIFCHLFLIFSGCSGEDSVPPHEPDYFSAVVDGEIFFVDDLNGTLECRKFLTEMGTINLAVTVKTHQGESIEFSVLNYTGKKIYSFDESLNNKNKVAYKNSLGSWSAGDYRITNRRSFNNLSVLDDNGAFLKGTLSFDGYDSESLSRKAVTNGKFNLRVRPVE